MSGRPNLRPVTAEPFPIVGLSPEEHGRIIGEALSAAMQILDRSQDLLVDAINRSTDALDARIAALEAGHLSPAALATIRADLAGHVAHIHKVINRDAAGEIASVDEYGPVVMPDAAGLA